MPDAITMLKDDHRRVEKLFKEFEDTTDLAIKTRQRFLGEITEVLSVHAEIEEHHVVKLGPEDERFHPKVQVLIENVRHHVEVEESEFFPRLREAFGRNDMKDFGDAMERARTLVPTRPHPGAPDEPPANAVVGLVTGLVDRVRSRIGV